MTTSTPELGPAASSSASARDASRAGEATNARPRAGASAYDLATVGVLWRRDLLRFFREKSRIAGALIQPLIFWLVIGSGMASTFRLPGAEHVGYLEYFYPGVILMVVLFASIFATMSVIDDRHAGFLQAVLVGPGSRGAVVLGKCLGATSIAMAQAALFLLLAPVAGFSYAHIAWGPLLAALFLTSLALTATGFAVAWWLDSTQGYHVVMSVLLLPLWIVSGAMFPGGARGSVMAAVMAANPMSYATSAVRRALYHGALPAGTALSGAHPAVELGVLLAFAVVALALATRVCYRRR